MRTFFAVPVNSALQQALMNKIRALDAQDWASQVRWTPVKNWHLTLKFIGELTSEQVSAIEVSMQDWFAEGMSYFDAEVLAIKGFPQIKTGPYLVASLDATLLLQGLVREIEDQLRAFDIPKEKRAFRPHITLGKWTGAAHDFPQLSECLMTTQLRVDQVNFYQSLQNQSVPEYRLLNCFSLETY